MKGKITTTTYLKKFELEGKNFNLKIEAHSGIILIQRVNITVTKGRNTLFSRVIYVNNQIIPIKKVVGLLKKANKKKFKRKGIKININMTSNALDIINYMHLKSSDNYL